MHPDGALDLGDDGESWEDSFATLGGTDDSLGGNGLYGRDQTLEVECVFAETTLKREASRVLEADGVRDLALEWGDFLCLVGGGVGADGVFTSIETETFSQMNGIGSGDGGAETLNWGEYLFVQIPLYVRL